MSFKNPETDCLRAFTACPSTTDQNLLQKLNHFAVSMDVYLHAKNQLYTLNSFQDIKVQKILQSDWSGMFWTII